ncbi:MAG: LD-carboxypeptidase [Bacteroidetes bacterium]|nr:LD-carboxypeptidase [Bacteroidota bacterium]
MITPPSLKPGDTIAIIAPARKISAEELETAFQWFTSWGLKVKLGSHLFGSHFQYSGTDAERASDLQQMLDDPEVMAIFAARGGYGTLRIIDELDFSGFCQNPKWIVGFSDVTVLHSHIQVQFGIESLHAAMPFTFPLAGSESEVMNTLWKALSGQDLSYMVAPHALSKKGTCQGVLTGGNLSILYALSGSISDIDTDGKVLFLEDLDEYLYHVDRMMLNLKRSGKLSNLSGLIVGGMTKMNDNAVPFGKTAEQIIAEIVADYNFPVCFGFPAGHLDDNRALILGRNVTLKVTGTFSTLEFGAAIAE